VLVADVLGLDDRVLRPRRGRRERGGQEQRQPPLRVREGFHGRAASVGVRPGNGLNRGCHDPPPVESTVCRTAGAMTLRLFNSLTRRVEAFQPIDPARTTMYVCGPTVYNYVHIGNARGPVVFD